MRRWQVTIGIATTALGAAWLAPHLSPVPPDEGAVDVEIETPPEPAPPRVLYIDEDGDGYGGPEVVIDPDLARGGLSTFGGDCDDHDARMHPNAREVAGDGVDQDCDGRDRAASPELIPEIGAPVLEIVAPQPRPEPEPDWDRMVVACGMG